MEAKRTSGGLLHTVKYPLKGWHGCQINPLRETQGKVFYTRWSVHRLERTHGGDIHMVKRTYGGVYTWWSVHTVECNHRGAIRKARDTYGGNIHTAETYTRWNVHRVECTHVGEYTEGHTHGRTHTQRGYTLEGTNIRSDIHTEGLSTRRDIHMKEETHGGTYTEGAYTRRRHTLERTTYRGDIHGGGIHGGDIHGGDIHMKEQIYEETYTWWSVHRVECVHGGDIRIHTVGPQREHTRGGGKNMME